MPDPGGRKLYQDEYNPDLTLPDPIVADLLAVGTFRLKEKPKSPSAPGRPRLDLRRQSLGLADIHPRSRAGAKCLSRFNGLNGAKRLNALNTWTLSFNNRWHEIHRSNPGHRWLRDALINAAKGKKLN